MSGRLVMPPSTMRPLALVVATTCLAGCSSAMGRTATPAGESSASTTSVGALAPATPTPSPRMPADDMTWVPEALVSHADELPTRGYDFTTRQRGWTIHWHVDPRLEGISYEPVAGQRGQVQAALWTGEVFALDEKLGAPAPGPRRAVTGSALVAACRTLLGPGTTQTRLVSRDGETLVVQARDGLAACDGAGGATATWAVMAGEGQEAYRPGLQVVRFADRDGWQARVVAIGKLPGPGTTAVTYRFADGTTAQAALGRTHWVLGVDVPAEVVRKGQQVEATTSSPSGQRRHTVTIDERTACRQVRGC